MKKLFLTFLIAFLTIVAVNAQGIAGKWKASVEGPQGSMELTFTFKVDGEKLTGTISTDMGEMELTDGKVNGNEFSYVMDMMGNPMTQKGKLEGDVIKIKMEMPGGGPDGPGGPGELVLKRIE